MTGPPQVQPTIRLTDLFRPTEIVILKAVVETGRDLTGAELHAAVTEVLASAGLSLSVKRVDHFVFWLKRYAWLEETSEQRYQASKQTLAIAHVLKAINPIAAKLGGKA